MVDSGFYSQCVGKIGGLASWAWCDLTYSLKGSLLMKFYSKEEQKKETKGQCVIKGGGFVATVLTNFFFLPWM